jgi:hypothetical protein
MFDHFSRLSSINPFDLELLRQPRKGPVLSRPGKERPGNASFQAILPTPSCKVKELQVTEKTIAYSPHFLAQLCFFSR